MAALLRPLLAASWVAGAAALRSSAAGGAGSRAEALQGAGVGVGGGRASTRQTPEELGMGEGVESAASRLLGVLLLGPRGEGLPDLEGDRFPRPTSGTCARISRSSRRGGTPTTPCR
ncbi:unnamed protein product [Prorocentrum cordatum]|uniref:Uncharacterized protein n=1 Tax=Prorocentrum cordatum TaxID=2364126 RepID=A0ABN9XV89_9DINO|nr:unnamed protein product [Polarella glacialis]